MRPNNPRQALLLLLLLSLLSPATVFSWVYSTAHSFSTFPSISTLLSLPFSPRMHAFSLVAKSPLFKIFFFFCKPVSLFYVSHFLTLFSVCLTYHLLPSTLACICNTCARVYLKMILCRFPVRVVCASSVCHVEETQQWWEV